MPVRLVAPEDWGSFWVVVRGLIIVHFGGPWEEDEKAEEYDCEDSRKGRGDPIRPLI